MNGKHCTICVALGRAGLISHILFLRLELNFKCVFSFKNIKLIFFNIYNKKIKKYFIIFSSKNIFKKFHTL
jgi:hypothetical protein